MTTQLRRTGAKQKFYDHIKQVVAAYRGLIALTEKGVFRLPVGDGEDDDGESTSSSGRYLGNSVIFRNF